jgi:hypothetical protein
MHVPHELWLPLLLETQEPDSWPVLYQQRTALGGVFKRACAPLTARMFLCDCDLSVFERLWRVFGMAWAYTALYVLEFGEYGMPWAVEARLMGQRERTVYMVTGVLEEAEAVAVAAAGAAGAVAAVSRQVESCTGGRQHRAVRCLEGAFAALGGRDL